MKGHMSTENGEIILENEVLKQYAGSAAVECAGVVGMASVNVKDGLGKLLMRDKLSHGVNVLVENNVLTIDLHIIVAYGVSIATVAQNLVDNVKYKIENYTGMKVRKVNVLVEGVRVVDEE
ncbi:MAG: Asp23/Gls24 family envelope stress response protein [Lachnospiraceae bacterium]|nr:Asp23/Gls24 family envelope stress response protein [Lachnospiraceae bacterium]